MYSREEIIKEANHYFERNFSAMNNECSNGIKVFCDFYKKNLQKIKIENMLEIGCGTGFNLIYMNKNYGIKGYGIDPSDMAINYGKKINEENGTDIILSQGFADSIPYESECFDMVYIGFCLYQVERELMARTVAEMDRVLTFGGVLVITDFDTPINYVRENIHNKVILTYKTDYSSYVKPFGYTLIGKECYSHSSFEFDPDIQERLSTQVFYKEKLDNLYVKG